MEAREGRYGDISVYECGLKKSEYPGVNEKWSRQQSKLITEDIPVICFIFKENQPEQNGGDISTPRHRP